MGNVNIHWIIDAKIPVFTRMIHVKNGVKVKKWVAENLSKARYYGS